MCIFVAVTYTRGLCARCDLSARRPPLFSRSLRLSVSTATGKRGNTKPNRTTCTSDTYTAVACTYPERTHLLTTPGTSIRDGPRRRAGAGGSAPSHAVSCAGPAPAARGLSFAGTRERHYRSAITRPRARERRSDDETRSGGAGGRERGVEREQLTAGGQRQANYDTHTTERPILPIFGLESAPY